MNQYLISTEDAVMPVDTELTREQERFTRFATEQMARMNANVIGGKTGMQVHRDDFGLYRASYKAIDVDNIICQVHRADRDPRYFVGTVLYKEQTMECTAQDEETCLTGPFKLATEKASRIIYSSKRGGGWY